MEMFIWNMAISFQLLFIIISGVIFIYLREKSFKYYALYNICMILYLLSRSDENYNNFQLFISNFIGITNAEIFTQILNFFIQVIFYMFYSIFALYFLDLDKRIKKYFDNVIWMLRILTALFFIIAVVCFVLKNSDLYILFYTFLFLPVMLAVFFISVLKALKYSGKHKNYFLFGVCAYVFCALVAFAGTFIPALNMRNPITYFYIGIVIETIFFSLGLAYKIKLINDEKNRVRNLVTKHKHQQQISKLKGLLEGEERERKRIAAELHDGIAGDLSAIKYNIAYLNKEDQTSRSTGIVHEISQIIDRACIQIREISHNLSPSSVTDHGLLQAVDNYCRKVENIYKIKVDFIFSGEMIDVGITTETHIYRIIQELVNNVVKHSEATAARVEIRSEYPNITLLVNDNGKGFKLNGLSKGIGLSNIDTRVTFLEAVMKRESNQNGTANIVTINVNKIHRN